MPTIHVIDADGDLLTFPAEALVNPWNRNFVPRWLLLPQGVSEMMKKQTGPGPWKTLARRGVLQVGDAVATDAGKMAGPRYLIHVAGLTASWRATPNGIARCATNATRLANELGVRSLAMPLIGAGTGGLTAAASRAALEQGLAQFPRAARDTCDLQVSIVAYAHAPHLHLP